MSKPTYEELEAKVKQLEADNEKAMSVLKEANDAVLLAKSKFEALAAENAAMKSAIDSTIGWQQSTDAENVESVRMLIDLKTPATSAFLAEVRAQGVEMLNTQFKKCTGVLCADSVVSTAEHFATQLRKGVQS
ncbi:TPA: hypothetical protein ACNROG_000949 [Citrobacter koseri]